MDVTPQLIEQIEFSEKFRGYDPDQVDDFLERVGASLSELLAEVDELTGRVQQAERDAAEARDRAASAPVAAVVAAPASVPVAATMSDEEEIAHATRTLTLAQRTAEAAIAEARAEAAKMTEAAHSRAEAATRDATAEAERLLRDAHAQREELVRRAREDAEAEFGTQKTRFTEEIRVLDGQRTELSGHVSALEERISEYRAHLTGFVDQMRQVIDDPTTLAPLPPLGFDLSAPVASPFYSTGAVPSVSIGNDPLATPSSERVSGDDVAVVDAVPVEAGEPWGPGSWSELDESEGQSAFDMEPTQTLTAQEVDEIASATGQHDRYLSKLDAAVNPVSVAEPESDDAMTAFFEGDDPGAGRRFGRRR